MNISCKQVYYLTKSKTIKNIFVNWNKTDHSNINKSYISLTVCADDYM